MANTLYGPTGNRLTPESAEWSRPINLMAAQFILSVGQVPSPDLVGMAMSELGSRIEDLDGIFSFWSSKIRDPAKAQLFVMKEYGDGICRYFNLLELGAPLEVARAILPRCAKPINIEKVLVHQNASFAEGEKISHPCRGGVDMLISPSLIARNQVNRSDGSTSMIETYSAVCKECGTEVVVIVGLEEANGGQGVRDQGREGARVGGGVSN